MKVSELAKELGYKTPELTELAKRRSIDITSAADLPPQLVALIKAKIPSSSKLHGDDLALLKGMQAQAESERARKEEEKSRKAEEKAKKEAERAAKKAAQEEKKKAKEAKEQAAAPKPKEAAKPAVAETKTPEKKVTTRKKKAHEVEITPTLKPEPPKVLETKLVVEGPVDPEAAANKRVIEIPESSSEVRVLRPFDVDKFSRDVVKPVEGKLPQKTAKGKEAVPAAKVKPKKTKMVPRSATPTAPPQPRPKPIDPTERKYKITPPISVRDFSAITAIKVPDILRRLMEESLMLTVNSTIREEQVVILGIAFNRNIEIVKATSAEERVTTKEKVVGRPEDLVVRPPIVTFMGHVDHGKTSLMDKIRSANVAAGEAGGITQHIGAYQVKTPTGKIITFLDTPGHEAFTHMRARGANVTDIAVIVVAADEGVMPQTEEAISHAKAANVTIMVAVNKIDKPQANAQKARNQLAKIGLVAEEYGGQTIFCEVSAMTGQGVDHLLEMLLLQAEILDLKADPKRAAHGWVLEARMSERKGPVANVLVQNGTLRRGDILVCGKTHGRIRAMEDERGGQVQEASPSTPVSVLGLVEVPQAGDKFSVVESLSVAQRVAEEREDKGRASPTSSRGHVSLENLFQKMEKGAKEVRVILKTDVRGSAEAIINALGPLTAAKEVSLRVIHNAVGGVAESDVLLADASDAIIMGFNVGADSRVEQLAKERGVQIKNYKIIYELVDQVKAAMEGKLEPERVEEVIGTAEVRQLFNISRLGTVAGSFVRAGKLERGASVRVIRNRKVIHTGKVDSLRRIKDDVREVAEGYECGLKVAGFDTLAVGDMLEVFVIKEIARKLF